MPREFSGTVARGPVTVTKTTETQDEGLIVEYAVASTGESAVAVRLSDRLRVETVEDLGFHEDHEPPRWTSDGGQLELRASLDPGEERSYVLGVVADVAPGYEPAEPTLEVEASGFFDRAGRPLAEAAEAAAPSTDDEGGDGGEDGTDGGEDGTDGGEDGTDGGEDAETAAGAADVVSTLAAQLEAGAVPESELSTLRRHLGAGSREGEPADLERVRERLARLDDATDAMEALLGVRSEGKDAVAELHDRVDDVVDELDAVRRRQESTRDRLDDLADAVEAQEAALESFRSARTEDLEAVRRDVREEVADLRRSVDADLAALEADLDAFERLRRALVESLGRPGDVGPVGERPSRRVASGSGGDREDPEGAAAPAFPPVGEPSGDAADAPAGAGSDVERRADERGSDEERAGEERAGEGPPGVDAEDT